MKRYNLEDTGPDVDMVENPVGDWVKWEDIKGSAKAYNDWVDRGWPVGDSTKCNCEEMYEVVKYAHADGSDAVWFCPSHGYKKL